jgi:hypothetical protein
VFTKDQTIMVFTSQIRPAVGDNPLNPLNSSTPKMNFAFRLLNRDTDKVVSTSKKNVYFDAYLMYDQNDGNTSNISIPIVNCSDYKGLIEE